VPETSGQSGPLPGACSESKLIAVQSEQSGDEDEDALVIDSDALSDDGAEDTPADVLVVDDHALNRAAILRLLRKAGISAIATDSAIGATRLAVRCQVSVVVADLNMPAMQGSSLLQVFRRNPRLCHVGMVLLSGVSAQELVSAASEVGADAAIAKIEMASTLVPAVNKLLRRASRPRHVSGKVSLYPSILNKKNAAGS
jgi:two-component system, chemotaxis family, chemotaxis protein CheY